MDVERQIAYWREGAEEDFAVALELTEKKRVRHALFLAELALVKMLKAHVGKTTKEVPPKTHNLLRLIELAKMEMEAERKDSIARFQEYCLEGRYPEHLPVPPSLEIAQAKIEQCQGNLSWLKSRLD